LKIDSSSVVLASQMEGKADLLMVKAYKEKQDNTARIDCLKRAAVCYNESYSTYQKASMRMFAKAVKNKSHDALEAVKFENDHNGCENPKLKEFIGKLISSKEFRARLGITSHR